MLHLITGGSGSGKSRYAEEQILKLGPGRRIYVATMYPYDEESLRRIDRAIDIRIEFETVECYDPCPAGVSGRGQYPAGVYVKSGCHEMFRPEGAGIHTVEAVLKGIWHLREQAENLVLVTNEIFRTGRSTEIPPAFTRNIWAPSIRKWRSGRTGSRKL